MDKENQIEKNDNIKQTVKEILSLIDLIPTNDCNELNHLHLLKSLIATKYNLMEVDK